VIGWRLAVSAQVAIGKLATAQGDDRDFYTGKIASARFYVQQVLPQLAVNRQVIEQSDLALMDLSDTAW
jgi:Acetyl-CoA dehydrogenase C-terminal like